MAKNTLKFEIKFKMADFRLGLGHATKRLFFSLGLKCTASFEFCMEQFCHTQSCDPHQIHMFTPSDVCAKFWGVLSITSPSTTPSCFIEN